MHSLAVTGRDSLDAMDAAAIAQALDEYATPGFAFSPAALPLPVLLPSGASVPLGSLLQLPPSSPAAPSRRLLLLGRNLL